MNGYDAEVAAMRDDAQRLVSLFSRLECCKFNWEEGDMDARRKSLHVVIDGCLKDLMERNGRLLEGLSQVDIPIPPSPTE